MVQLEALHGAGDARIIILRGRAREIALRRQSVAQGDDAGPAVARFQLVARDRRPPAARGDGAFQIDLFLHQPGIFRPLRRQRAQEGHRVGGLEPCQHGKGIVIGHFAQDARIDLGRFHHARMHIAGIGQEGAGQCHLDPAQIAFGPGRADRLRQGPGIIACDRQAMVPGPLQRGKQRRPPRRLIGRGPERRITARLVEGRDGLIRRRRLGQRLREGADLCDRRLRLPDGQRSHKGQNRDRGKARHGAEHGACQGQHQKPRINTGRHIWGRSGTDATHPVLSVARIRRDCPPRRAASPCRLSQIRNAKGLATFLRLPVPLSAKICRLRRGCLNPGIRCLGRDRSCAITLAHLGKVARKLPIQAANLTEGRQVSWRSTLR